MKTTFGLFAASLVFVCFASTDVFAQTIVFNGQPIDVRVLKITDDGLTVEMHLTKDDVVTITAPWSTLSVVDQDRFRKKLKKTSAIGGAIAGGGKMIAGLSVTMKSGRTIYGLRVEEKTTDELLVLKKSGSEIPLSKKNIVSIENMMLPEMEVLTKEELYEKKLVNIDMENGQDNYTLANDMATLQYWEKALEHYERAGLLSPELEEPAADRMLAMEEELLNDFLENISNEIQNDIRAKRWLEASEKIVSIETYAPHSPIRTRWTSQLPTISEEIRKTLRKNAVQYFYVESNNLLQQWAAGSLTPGTNIPGAVVHLKIGETIRGLLIEDDESQIVIQDGERLIRIDRDAIQSISLAKLNNTKPRPPTLAETRNFISNTSTGLESLIYAQLMDVFGKYSTPNLEINKAFLQELWADRMTAVYEISKQGRKVIAATAQTHSAEYGTGSWIREGLAGQSSFDEEKWWERLRASTRLNIIKAMAAEQLFDVVEVRKLPCRKCGGAGVKRQYSRGETQEVGCKVCLGAGVFVTISYR